MTAQMDNLRVIANNAAASVNARGEALEFHLQDIPIHAREIALHGIRHGAAHALTATHLQSGQDLRAIEPGYLVVENPDAHEDLIEEFADHAAAIVDITPPKNTLKHVFLED